MAKSSSTFSLFTPPDGIVGMKVLDRSVFRKVFQVPALRIETKLCSLFLKQLRNNLLNQPRMKNIMPDSQGEKSRKVLLLNPEKKISEWSEEEREVMHSQGAEEIKFDLVLGYEHWTAEQVLRALLPAEIAEVPSSFETIGHVAHVNLRDAHLQYKDVIGQVILDKNSPQIKTVVNKANTIDSTFRFFKMEVLAGEQSLQTSVKEHGCVYEFDFSTVYWNSRLQTEHKRLIDKFASSDVICDMFAGVGPFAIPAAKKGCSVYANDLNPESYKALCHNAKINHIENKIKTYNMDGRDFVKKLVSDWGKQELKSCESSAKICEDSKLFTQVIMNLPASAAAFLDIFKSLFTPFKDKFVSSESSSVMTKLPQIHCYCFSKSLEPAADAKKQVEEVLGVELVSECTYYYVRDVAPQKAMICMSFRLPESVAFMDQNQASFKRPREEDQVEKLSKEIKLAADNGDAEN